MPWAVMNLRPHETFYNVSVIVRRLQVYLELLEARPRCLDPLAVLHFVGRQHLKQVQKLHAINELSAQIANVDVALAEMFVAAELSSRSMAEFVPPRSEGLLLQADPRFRKVTTTGCTAGTEG